MFEFYKGEVLFKLAILRLDVKRLFVRRGSFKHLQILFQQLHLADERLEYLHNKKVELEAIIERGKNSAV